MVRFIRLLLNEKGRFLWSAHRITERQKAGKARSIKGKQLKNSRSTASRPPVARLSSASADPTRFYNKKGSKTPETHGFRGFLVYQNVSQSPVSRRKPKPATSVVGREKAMDWAGESGPAFSKMERMISAFCSARATISTTSFSWAMVML